MPPIDLVGPGNWAAFKGLVRDAQETFAKDLVIWQRESSNDVAEFNEQEDKVYTSVNLEALIGYNYFRTWPITLQKESGALDNQNMIMLINKDYLQERGFITAQGYFDFKPEADYFIHRGIKYKSEGDTFLSQANNTPLLVQLILRREEVLTGMNPLNQT